MFYYTYGFLVNSDSGIFDLLTIQIISEIINATKQANDIALNNILNISMNLPAFNIVSSEEYSSVEP